MRLAPPLILYVNVKGGEARQPEAVNVTSGAGAPFQTLVVPLMAAVTSLTAMVAAEV